MIDINKVNRIREVLKTENTDAWMIISKDNKDSYYTKLVAPNIYSFSIALFTQNENVVFSSTLDSERVERYAKDFRIYKYSRNQNSTLTELLTKYIRDNNIKKIALNYSTMNDFNIDIIGYGTYQYITNLLIDNVEYISPQSFLSAEKIIYALSDSKEDAEIDKMKICAKRALDILMMAFENIKAGITEIELVNLVHKITEDTRKDFLETQKGEVICETYSWEEECCPIVLTGSSFLKGGHALSTENSIEKGNTVYFDFGICLTFKDLTKWSSDIQRTGYLLKDDENDPPQYIKDRFDTIINSIKLGMDTLEIGIEGYKIDDVVRNYIVLKGYPEYDHGTGHAIGELPHNPGAYFAPSKKGMSGLKVQPNGVYTIEPRIALENGVSIEEMVAIRKNGKVETLCKRQTEAILIKSI